MTFLEYLDDIVDKAQANVEDYEAFHDKIGRASCRERV